MSVQLAHGTTVGDTSLPVELVVLFALAIGLYGLGWQRQPSSARVATWRAACYGGGLLALALALLTPVAEYSDVLLSAHMIQHLLILLAAPLLLLGEPLQTMIWALPSSPHAWLERVFSPGQPAGAVFRLPTHPLLAGVLYVGALGVWHLPAFYDAALADVELHEFEHLIFLGTSLLYWWPVVYPLADRRRLGYGSAIVYLSAPMIEGSVIGAALTFASRPLYATYAAAPRVLDVSVLFDQQLGGLIMWIPGSLLYILPIMMLLIRLVQREEHAARVVESSALDETLGR